MSRYFALAKKAILEERYDEAVALHKQGLALEPDNVFALWNVAFYYDTQADFVAAAAYYHRILALPADGLPPAGLLLAEKAGRNRPKVLYWAGLELIRRRDFATALVYLRDILNFLPGNVPTYYLAGICCLQTGDPSGAADYFRKVVANLPGHVDAWFNLGNALLLADKAGDAAACYRKALELEPDFAEAYYNYGRLLDEQEQAAAAQRCFDAAFKLKPHLQLPADEVGAKHLKFRYWKECRPTDDFFGLPVFVNCRDRVAPLKALVGWLLAAGHRNIFLLDNASTYPPLLAYYDGLAGEARVKVVRLGRNLGQKALWTSGLLSALKVATPFVYTDCDIVPAEGCPANAVEVFYRILLANPMVQRVGFGLRIDDIPDHYGKKAAIVDHERQFWQHRVADGVPAQYAAPIDTTFALYRHGNYHEASVDAIRTGPPFVARHTDWYLDTAALGEEERYYFTHADKDISTTAKALADGGLLGGREE